jgi:TIR domain
MRDGSRLARNLEIQRMPDRSSGAIFISYRREETAYPAGWLFNRLADTYGEDQIFKDVDSIELGDDFVDVITRAVASTDVLLALIGENWISATDESGRRRLDDPDDFVRLEIEAALTRGIRVIPILVDGATMPRDDQLPASLATLARRQALELSPSRFDFDTSRLLKVLDKTLADVREETLSGELKVRESGDRDQITAPRAPDEPRWATQLSGGTESRSVKAARLAKSSQREHHTRAALSSGDGLRERVVRHWRVLAGIGLASLLALVAIVLVTTRSHSPSTSPAGVQGGASTDASSFTDDFSNKQYGWENVGGSEFGGRYSHGSYYLTAARDDSVEGFNNVVASPAHASSSDDVRIKVDARMTSGTAIFGRAYGIFCRRHGSETLYAFDIWKNGAQIAKKSNGSYERISKVDSSVTSQPGEEYRELEAVCRSMTQGGDNSVELEFWVNGTKILTATDPSPDEVEAPLLSGRYGVQATFGEAGVGATGETIEVEFDNFEVTRL